MGLSLHILFGLILLVVTLSNAKRLRALSVADRLKRISKVTAGLAVLQLISGMVLGGIRHLTPNLYFVPGALLWIHIICALAILAQASSVATAYDMWEEKEFGQ